MRKHVPWVCCDLALLSDMFIIYRNALNACSFTFLTPTHLSLHRHWGLWSSLQNSRRKCRITRWMTGRLAMTPPWQAEGLIFLANARMSWFWHGEEKREQAMLTLRNSKLSASCLVSTSCYSEFSGPISLVYKMQREGKEHFPNTTGQIH